MADTLATFRDDLAISGLTDKTKSTYLAIAASFLKSAGKPPARGYPRAAYVKFFGGLVDAGRSPSYMHLNYAALRRLMNALELPAPPIKARDLPKLRRTTPETWVEPDDVGKMIRAVLTEPYDDQARCAMALATTFAMRSSELRTCEIDGSHIIIHVAKSGGATVRQLLPPEIRPYVLCAPIEHGAYWLEQLYHRLEKATGQRRPRGSRSGFHHIRRAVNTALVRAGVPETLIIRFIRWKPAGFSGPLYYTRGNPDELDRQVFERHPFLAFWSEDEADKAATHGSPADGAERRARKRLPSQARAPRAATA